MKNLLYVASILLCASTALAQTAIVTGTITDQVTQQPVVGAKVIFSQELKTLTDFDGNYRFDDVPFGTYRVMITMMSYDTLYRQIDIDKKDFAYNFTLGGSQELEEVQVVANLAQDRKTPVAVSTIGKKEINEELGSQDLPMILNSKPGIHATQRGGGDGDARITIRGFNQRNVGVMIDGVPVNDMENGWVYWSNWFGLDEITSQIQVQRGLGATKLAMPSVGGTMNIITDNTGGKSFIKARQEVGTGNFTRTSLSYKSGNLGNGWGILASVSYKKGNGWADGLFTEGAFGYLKVQKKMGNHVVSLSGFGAPQHHGQRLYDQPIAYWDTTYAQKLGVTDYVDSNKVGYGIQHNRHWGYVTDSATGQRSVLHERRNFYAKPQITLKDFWKVNEKLSWSNMAYVSIGKGGGQKFFNSASQILYDSTGLVNWDQIIYNNKYKKLFGQIYPTTDAAYDDNLLKSSEVLAASVNEHYWIGGLSQIDWKVADHFDIAAGVDYRNYVGIHYNEILDLLGGDYFINNANQNAASDMKTVGDRIARYDYQKDRKAFMQWAGSFAQVEYDNNRWTAFLNVSTVANSYRGEDYHMNKLVTLEDTVLEVGYDSVHVYNGKRYWRGSPEAKANSTGDLWLFGATFKAGANYNIDEKNNVFLNLGYLDRTPQFSNVVDNNTNTFFAEILNEKIQAIEAGYGFRSRPLSVNLNGYYTIWENKPFPYGVAVPDPNDPQEIIRANVNGMDALHMGVELDAAWNVNRMIVIEGMAAVGDWKWTSTETVFILEEEFEFDARGIMVGNSAQSTAAGSIRFNYLKGGYIKMKYTFFDRYYSDFNPFNLTGPNGGRQSWRIPSYGLMSFHAGYRYNTRFGSAVLRANVFNALNTLYISDATNNRNGNDFGPNSAGVFIGQGMRFNVSLGFEF